MENLLPFIFMLIIIKLRTVRPESCRRYDEDAPPGRGDASPSATTHERVSILLR